MTYIGRGAVSLLSSTRIMNEEQKILQRRWYRSNYKGRTNDSCEYVKPLKALVTLPILRCITKYKIGPGQSVVQPWELRPTDTGNRQSRRWGTHIRLSTSKKRALGGQSATWCAILQKRERVPHELSYGFKHEHVDFINRCRRVNFFLALGSAGVVETLVCCLCKWYMVWWWYFKAVFRWVWYNE